MKSFLLLLTLLISFGCNNPQPTNNAPPLNNTGTAEKYQIVASHNGTVYRLDKTTGEVWMIKDNAMQQVKEEQFTLKLNHRYYAEDRYAFTYLGKAQLGEIKKNIVRLRDGKEIEILQVDSSGTNDPLDISEKKVKPTHRYNPSTGKIEPIQ